MTPYIGACVVALTEIENTRNVDFGERVIDSVLEYGVHLRIAHFHNKKLLAGN